MTSHQTSPVNQSAGALLVLVCLTSSIAVSRRGSAAAGGGLQRWAGPAVVGRVEGDPGGDDLVDAVQDVVGEHDVGGRELGFEVIHGSRPDDRGGDGRVAQDEGDRHL